MTEIIPQSLPPVLHIADGIVTTSSLDVASYFDKRHTHVLDAISALTKSVPPDFTGPNFRLSEYEDKTGRVLPSFNMTRDGFTLLAMGFTGPKALKFKLAYIEAFNKMEAALKTGAPTRPNPLDNARASLDVVRLVKELESARSVAARKVIYATMQKFAGMAGIPLDSMDDFVPPAPAEPPEVTRFFACMAELEKRGHKVNHSRSAAITAYNLPQVARLCANEGISLPANSLLRRALKASSMRLFLGIKTINSGINTDHNQCCAPSDKRRPASISCWMFAACPPSGG